MELEELSRSSIERRNIAARRHSEHPGILTTTSLRFKQP
jgi:hypothetical protein